MCAAAELLGFCAEGPYGRASEVQAGVQLLDSNNSSSVVLVGMIIYSIYTEQTPHPHGCSTHLCAAVR